MIEPLVPSAITTAARADLRAALDYLAACKVDVLIEGECYAINGQSMTEGELISFAKILTPDLARIVL